MKLMRPPLKNGIWFLTERVTLNPLLITRSFGKNASVLKQRDRPTKLLLELLMSLRLCSIRLK